MGGSILALTLPRGQNTCGQVYYKASLKYGLTSLLHSVLPQNLAALLDDDGNGTRVVPQMLVEIDAEHLARTRVRYNLFDFRFEPVIFQKLVRALSVSRKAMHDSVRYCIPSSIWMLNLAVFC